MEMNSRLVGKKVRELCRRKVLDFRNLPPPSGGHQITLVLIEPLGRGCPSEMRNKVFDFP